MVADVLSLPSPEAMVRRTARYAAVQLAHVMIRHGSRGAGISSDATRQSMKAQWLDETDNVSGSTRGSAYAGRLVWASADGHPTTNKAVVFSVRVQELLEAMDWLVETRDSAEKSYSVLPSA